MVTQAAANRPSLPTPVLFGVTLGLGLVTGALISTVAFWLARYGPSGGNWSFKGNGALMAYGLFPAALAAGWTTLVLHRRSQPAWLGLGLGAGLVGILLLALDAALLPVFGPAADRSVGPVLLYALLAWAVVAPIAATWLTVSRRRSSSSLGLQVAAGVVWLTALVIGLTVVGVIIPAGS